jgi:hypothetical protein
LFEVLEGDILIADVIVDEGDGGCGSGVFVVMEFIVFRIGQIDFGVGVMGEELFFQGDELVAFLGVARDGEAGHGEFEAEREFDGGYEDGVVAEDFF